MKADKSYITTSLVMQMIVVPSILTVGLYFAAKGLGSIFGSTGDSWLGSSGIKLIYVITAFLGAMIAGVFVGYRFSKPLTDKSASPKDRYLTPLIPIIYALIFGILALLISHGNYNSRWWGYYILKNPAYIIYSIPLALTGLNFLLPITELSGYMGYMGGILLQEHISKTAIKNKTSRNLKITFALLCIVSIGFLYVNTRDVISNGMIELRYGKSTIGNELTDVDLIKMAPFKDHNGLAKLDGRSSLSFAKLEDMPRLDGATAAYPVYAAFTEAVYKGLGDYYNLNKDSKDVDVFNAFVDSYSFPLNIVKCSQTSGAYQRLLDKQTDIIFVAEPSKAQLEKVKAKGEALSLISIGYEAFVFFTNIKNPIEKLTEKQIREIYTGKIKNWKEVGGENNTIMPFQRPEDSGSQTIMENKVMKGLKMMEPTTETFAGGMGDMITKVAAYRNSRNSIGYSFMYYSSTMIKNKQIKYISINGVKPSTQTVRNKEYKFTIPVYAVTLKSNNNKNVEKLLKWITSSEGQSLVKKTGYVSLH